MFASCASDRSARNCATAAAYAFESGAACSTCRFTAKRTVLRGDHVSALARAGGRSKKDALFRSRVLPPLAQPDPRFPTYGVLVLDHAFLHERALPERLERVVAEELAADIVLEVVYRQRTGRPGTGVPRLLDSARSGPVVMWPRRRRAWRERERRVVEHGAVPCRLVLDVVGAHEARGLLVYLVCYPTNHGSKTRRAVSDSVDATEARGKTESFPIWERTRQTNPKSGNEELDPNSRRASSPAGRELSHSKCTDTHGCRT